MEERRVDGQAWRSGGDGRNHLDLKNYKLNYALIYNF